MNRILRDLDAPRPTSDDWRALLGLIAFAIVFLAITSVGS